MPETDGWFTLQTLPNGKASVDTPPFAYAKFARSWLTRIKSLPPHSKLLGIDEETGIVNDGEAKSWTVFGRGNVYLIDESIIEFFPNGAIEAAKLKTITSPPSPDSSC